MALWTPALIDTALWLDAADADTITLNGSNVSQWDDKSGGTGHATQAVSANQPEYLTAELNGLNVLGFSGSPEFMEIAASLPSSASAFAVWRATNSPASLNQTMQIGGTVNQKWTHHRGGSGFTFATANGSAARTLSAPMNLSEYTITHAQGDGSTGAVSTNGGSLVSGNLYSWDTTNPSLGKDAGTTVRFLNGQVAEIIWVAEVVSTDIRQKIEGYLAHKWDLAASLPAEHPYKDSAPIAPVFYGTITNKDGNPAERRITVLDATGHCVATTTSDPITGAYNIDMPNDDPYTLVFDGEPDRNAQVFANVIPGEPPA